jgi:general secretion pathway protein K
VNTANGLTLLGIICGGAPDAKLCTDEDQMERFVEAVTMAKVMVPGMPLWGSPRMFTRTLSGKGSSAIAQAFQALQIDPVTWRSEAEVQKAITVESKVFSIYAEGVVPRMKTKDKCQADSDCNSGQTCADGFCADATRIRIHAVVDFRNASALGSQATGSNGTLPASQPANGQTGIQAPPPVGGRTSGAPPKTTNGSGSSSSQSSDSDIMAAYLTDPAGQIIYYRVE